MLRLVRRGDRHDPRELTVSFKLEGDFVSAADRNDAIIPSEALKNLVYRITREHGNRELETLGLALASEVLERQATLTRVRVDLSEQPWMRVEVGGKAQAQAFLSGSPEQRVASVTTNGTQVSVVAGIDDLMLMRSAGFAPSRRSAEIPDDTGTSDGLQPLLVGALSARWTYTSGDVTFDVHRRAIRSTILDTFVWQKGQSVQELLYAIADVILGTCEDIADVTLTFHERPYRPADLFAAGTENPDELFLVADEPVGTVQVTVERE
jgi:urate oxidase